MDEGEEMKKKLEERIIREGIVDTNRFRYVFKSFPAYAVIMKIEREKLGTTAAIDGWKIVKEWR